MVPETLYRFELAFEGEPQDVGLFQGLEDTPLHSAIHSELYSLFDKLPVPPDLDAPDGGAVIWWFTEAGVKEFSEALNAVIYELSTCGWQVIGASVEINAGKPCSLTSQDCLYSDEYQVAFSRTDFLEATFSDFSFQDFKEVSCIEPDNTIPVVFRKPSLRDKIQEASTRTAFSFNETAERDSTRTR